MDYVCGVVYIYIRTHVSIHHTYVQLSNYVEVCQNKLIALNYYLW